MRQAGDLLREEPTGEKGGHQRWSGAQTHTGSGTQGSLPEDHRQWGLALAREPRSARVHRVRSQAQMDLDTPETPFLKLQPTETAGRCQATHDPEGDLIWSEL